MNNVTISEGCDAGVFVLLFHFNIFIPSSKEVGVRISPLSSCADQQDAGRHLDLTFCDNCKTKRAALILVKIAVCSEAEHGNFVLSFLVQSYKTWLALCAIHKNR